MKENAIFSTASVESKFDTDEEANEFRKKYVAAMMILGFEECDDPALVAFTKDTKVKVRIVLSAHPTKEYTEARQ